MRLKVHLGITPMTDALIAGEIRVPGVDPEFITRLDFVPAVRELAWDFTELSLGTFLVARAAGTPLRLLPAILTAAPQHFNLYCNVERRRLAPGELAGKRIGIRHYTMTPGLWIRHLLEEEHGVDPATLHWVTFGDPHVTEFRVPEGVERVHARDMNDMLLAGELDAIVSEPVPSDSRLQPVFPDPAGAMQRWQSRHPGAVHAVHIAAAKRDCAEADAILEAFFESRLRAPETARLPGGIEAIRPSLELALDCAFRQGLIPRRFTLEELLA